MNVSEISIPVPWGQIAGKTWGAKNSTHPPILCLHGILDNCNTFDRLIPLLPSCFFYICLELPGHGYSSPFPDGFTSNNFVFLSAVDRAIRHLRLDWFIIMGHSFGGRIGAVYSALHPERVAKLIMLDTYGFFQSLPYKIAEEFKMSLDIPHIVEAIRARKTRPKYRYEDLVQRIIAGRSQQCSTLTREAAQILLARHIEKVPNEDLYYYTPDQHLKYYQDYLPIHSLEQMRELYKRTSCPVLILTSSESIRSLTQPGIINMRYIWKEQGARIVEIEGNHDVHINEPEKIKDLVETFLLEPLPPPRSKL